MKVKILVCSLIFAFVHIGKAQFVPDTIYVKKVSRAPEIDGEIDEIWNSVAETHINNWGQTNDGIDNATPFSYDFSPSFRMVWDTGFIYFLGEIEDDFVAEQSDLAAVGAAQWEMDSWVLCWGPAHPGEDNLYRIITAYLGYANSNHEDASAPVSDGWTTGGLPIADFVTGARALSDNGWIAEGKFSLPVMSGVVEDTEQFTDNSLIGLNALACDNDGESTRKHIGSWIKDARPGQADTMGIIKLLADQLTDASPIYPSGSFNLSPNPVVDILSISSERDISRISITNSAGILLRVYNDPNNYQVNLSCLKAGMYFIHIHFLDKSDHICKILKE